MRRYAPFASLGVLLALLLNAAVPAPPRADAAETAQESRPAASHDGEMLGPASRSDAWLARHSLVPRASVERAPNEIDGSRIHSDRAPGKRRR